MDAGLIIIIIIIIRLNKFFFFQTSLCKFHDKYIYRIVETVVAKASVSNRTIRGIGVERRIVVARSGMVVAIAQDLYKENKNEKIKKRSTQSIKQNKFQAHTQALSCAALMPLAHGFLLYKGAHAVQLCPMVLC